MSITSIITLNQLINWFQNFQENHYILKDFGFGEPYDIGTSRQMTFPYMWVTMNEDSSIAQVGHNKTAIPEVSFSIMFMDKINIQENYLDTNGFPSDNSQEILSDMIQCLQDLITHIQQDWIQYGVFVSQDISFFPAVDETPDKATGVVARFVLKLKQVNCIIPEAPTQVIVQPQQATLATLLTCETLLDCNNFQTYAYTGMTYSGNTITLNSINGNQISVSGIPTTISTSAITTNNTSVIVDSSVINWLYWEYNGAIDTTINIANLTDGKEMVIVVRNTNASSTFQLFWSASTTNSGFTSFISSKVGTTSNTGVISFPINSNNGTLTLTVRNINGTIVGSVS